MSEEVVIGNKRTLAPPKTCLLTVSNTCHLKCKMCDLWQKDTAHEEISIEECKHFINALGEFEGEPLELHLIGGETFIKKDIFDLIRHARTRNSRVVVTTSGYAITPEVAKEIGRSGLNMLNFSIESLQAQTHDFLRGVGGIHKKAMEAIEHVAHFAPETEMAINTIITKQNMHDVVALTKWVDDNKRLSQIYFMAVMRPFGSDLDLDWYDTERAHILWPDNYPEVETVLSELSAMKRSGVHIGNSCGQLEVFKAYFRDPRNFVKKTGCNLDEHALNVNAIGDVYLCFFMEKNLSHKVQYCW